jgi:hypothetical protein
MMLSAFKLGKTHFEYYDKIEPVNDVNVNKYRTETRTYGQKWRVLEQVDGDHLALYADAKNEVYRAATRHRFLNEKDYHSDWLNQAKLNHRWLMALSASMERPLITYGKMVGGMYKGKSLGKHIKTVCEYCPQNEYILHDIKVKEGFLSQNEVKLLADKFHLGTAPILYEGQFSKAICYPENKLSMIPFMFSQDPIYTNQMKGIIIRPVYDMCLNGTSKHMLLKKLNRSYIGKSLITVTKPVLTSIIIEIAQYMDNEAMKLNLLDKVIIEGVAFSSADIGKITGQYTQSVIDTVRYLKYNMLLKEERKLVHLELNRIIAKRLTMLLSTKAA